jgi:hemolysin-activating ACP:hemolysin acyltransferase
MHSPSSPSTEPVAPSGAPDLRFYVPRQPALALGLAVEHLMSKPAFARLPFGQWSGILVGQINRKQCCFVIDRDNKVQGFAGWALTDREKADAWISGARPLSSGESQGGDCIIFNAWSAHSPDVHRFMLAEFRNIFGHKRHVYFRRHYKDGRTRTIHLPVHRAGKASSALQAA